MNREAVVLGTPVYTTVAGRMGGVDQRLIADGRLRPLERLWAILQSASVTWLLVGLAAYAIGVAVSVWRWHLLLDAQDVQREDPLPSGNRPFGHMVWHRLIPLARCMVSGPGLSALPDGTNFAARRPGLATSAPAAIGAAVRDDPAAASGSAPLRHGADRRNFYFDSKVPQWLSPREKPRRRSATCAAAITR